DYRSNKIMIRNLFKEYYLWKGKNFILVNMFTPIFPSKINSKLFRKIRQYFAFILLYNWFSV
ncbi:MAG: hypothetical protein ABI840_11340, partial [bacterium]